VKHRHGLVVGKFAPLHLGHELVIRRAIDSCDEVTVLSYSKPEFPGCGPAQRLRWLSARFAPTSRLRHVVLTDALLASRAGLPSMPANDAPDDAQREFVGQICLQLVGAGVDAVFTSEDYGEGFARHLTGFFRARDPGAAPVVHVPVDRERRKVPVSGTQVRAAIHAHRAALSPLVYASFVQRVCLLGGESSGKTTLAAQLARVYETGWVPEYGRQLWEQKLGVLSFEDMRSIAERQVAAEEHAALEARRWLFCDTSPLTTLLYSRELFGRTDPALEALAGRPYGLTILCAPDFPFVQDGTRREPAFRDRQHAGYLAALRERGIPFVLVRGSLGERVEQVRGWLATDSR